MTKINTRREDKFVLDIENINTKGEVKYMNDTYHILDSRFLQPDGNKYAYPMAFINDASLFYKRCGICAEEINDLSFLLVFETHHYIILDCCGVWDLCQNLEIDVEQWS